jgi:FkbM family methyltransferase
MPASLALFEQARLSALRRLIAGKRVAALLVDSDCGPLLVAVGDEVGLKFNARGAYSAELSRLLTLVEPESNILVVGGHVGALAIPLAKACQSLTVIEANPETFRLLEINLLINKSHNVRALNFAANDKREELRFVANQANSGGSKRLPVVQKRMYFHDRPKIIAVPGVPLDEILADTSFDLIVMDIEGSEYFALRGMRRLLTKANKLAVEFIPHHLTNVAAVTVEEFVAQISPFFHRLFIPSKAVTLERKQFCAALQEMVDKGESDEGLIFF